MNAYDNYNKTPEVGAVPASIRRRLSVTDMALRFAVAATYPQYSAEQARVQREAEARPIVGKIGVGQMVDADTRPAHVDAIVGIQNTQDATGIRPHASALEGDLVTDTEARQKAARDAIGLIHEPSNTGDNYGFAV